MERTNAIISNVIGKCRSQSAKRFVTTLKCISHGRKKNLPEIDKGNGLILEDCPSSRKVLVPVNQCTRRSYTSNIEIIKISRNLLPVNQPGRPPVVTHINSLERKGNDYQINLIKDLSGKSKNVGRQTLALWTKKNNDTDAENKTTRTYVMRFSKGNLETKNREKVIMAPNRIGLSYREKSPQGIEGNKISQLKLTMDRAVNSQVGSNKNKGSDIETFVVINYKLKEDSEKYADKMNYPRFNGKLEIRRTHTTYKQDISNTKKMTSDITGSNRDDGGIAKRRRLWLKKQMAMRFGNADLMEILAEPPMDTKVRAKMNERDWKLKVKSIYDELFPLNLSASFWQINYGVPEFVRERMELRERISLRRKRVQKVKLLRSVQPTEVFSVAKDERKTEKTRQEQEGPTEGAQTEPQLLG